MVCTAVLSVEPGRPLLLAGVRDEFTDRPWQPPGRHWPAHPDLIGGRDEQAGGSWLAVSPGERRVSCVLNGTGTAAPPATRISRGALPLRAAAGQPLARAELADTDPFWLLTADSGGALVQRWDGRELTDRVLPPGLHLIVNSGLLTVDGAAAGLPGDSRPQERARVGHFAARFAEAIRPVPGPDGGAAGAWGEWLPLVDGDGLGPDDERALIVRRVLEDGRTWGTTSMSLVALADDWLRYDFCAVPGDPAAWRRVC